MIDAMGERLDVSVEHGARAAATHVVPGPMNVEPFGGGFFAATNCVTHDRIENFCATAGNRAEPCFTQNFKRVADRYAENSLSQMTNFDGGKSFDVKIGIERTQLTQKLEIPIFLQGRMQPADHVHLRDSKAERISHYADNFVNRIFKSVCIALLGGESAELAGEDANVGVIDVTVVDVGRVVAVLSLAHDVSDHSERVKVVRTIESKSVSL